jgi:predicted outer membrane protein
MQVLLAAVLTASAIPAAAASLSSSDAEYLTTAIQIQAGRYAMATYEQQHGTGAVKSFAASVVAQSSSDSRMLNALAKKYGVTPPKGPLVQDNYHYTQLVGLSGSALNKSFAREFRISDQVNLETYRDEMNHGQDAKLKAHAKQRFQAVQQEIKTLQRF